MPKQNDHAQADQATPEPQERPYAEFMAESTASKSLDDQAGDQMPFIPVIHISDWLTLRGLTRTEIGQAFVRYFVTAHSRETATAAEFDAASAAYRNRPA